MAFDAGQWVEIGQVFKDSLEYVLNNVKRSFSQDGQDHIDRFIFSSIMLDKPHSMVTPNGLARAIKTVFEDEIVRDFVLTLSFVFFSRWGGNEARYNELVESLAFASSASKPAVGRASFNGIRKDLLDDLAQEENVRYVLLDNKWFVVLLLMHLTVEVPAMNAGKTKKGSSA